MPKRNDIRQVIIIGSGPAGLQAAIHTARKKVRVTILGRIEQSSLNRAWIENYCCLEPGKGSQMLKKGRKQAEGFGSVFKDEDAVGISALENNIFGVRTESNQQIKGQALIIATGISRNKLGVEGENEYAGRGVSYCVDCDAVLFKGKKVALVGNGSAAVMGALLLTDYAREVMLIAQRLEVADSLVERLNASSVVQSHGQWIAQIKGDGSKVIGFINTKGESVEVDGIFIELGAKGTVELITELGVELDKETYTYIVTDKRQQTNVPGVFAAGDVCGPPFQVAKAVGEGCVAGIYAADYVKSLH